MGIWLRKLVFGSLHLLCFHVFSVCRKAWICNLFVNLHMSGRLAARKYDKIRMSGRLLGALKKEASVDYSLRMERLLSRSGWVEGPWARSLLLFGSTKKCNSLVIPLAFAVRKYEKVRQSRNPARFCCSEVRKNATAS